jgi:hypothetical protein
MAPPPGGRPRLDGFPPRRDSLACFRKFYGLAVSLFVLAGADEASELELAPPGAVALPWLGVLVLVTIGGVASGLLGLLLAEPELVLGWSLVPPEFVPCWPHPTRLKAAAAQRVSIDFFIADSFVTLFACSTFSVLSRFKGTPLACSHNAVKP